MKDNLNVTEQRILLFSVFVLSLCGITYELVLGSLATYFLGNPVLQYSITIGVFLSSMGLGSYLSRFFTRDILRIFIQVEIILGLVGGASVLVLYLLFSFTASYYLLHVFFLVLIGALVGLEIPLITRVLKQYGALKDILANVLSLDYLGALAGSILFPLLLYPKAGKILTSIFIGILNIAVALIIILKIKYKGKKKTDTAIPIVAIVVLIVMALYANAVTKILQKRLFVDDIVFSKQSKYQEIMLTRNGEDFRLYLNGSLQFSSIDEYRYHEMLVFPALYFSPGKTKDVIILGGGDGLAVRELLRDKSVRTITLVELDPEIISLARKNSSLKRINKDSLRNERVKVVVDDAFNYLTRGKKKYDVIIADFPDPDEEATAKLYTVEFFSLIKRSLKKDGIFVTQSTSPFAAPEAFWCINRTLNKVFKEVIPYHAFVPTFGDWGFNMASRNIIKTDELEIKDKSLKYFSKSVFQASLTFPKDSIVIPPEINTFNRPIVYSYYLKGWRNAVE